MTMSVLPPLNKKQTQKQKQQSKERVKWGWLIVKLKVGFVGCEVEMPSAELVGSRVIRC